ncbi:hypothetical protein MAPG_03453 [Magnaporthiopsis poae ATCC 64411]|uniref:Uncharacterized protein n=1 Tax=Magnaporthiopsis poae (strain ATCC 64411 / 73-15) TaxID=644358 RepID=A0A0C4DU19_MAGP6|nr:hypothetical protein MAPG_03453 [Magnaporthiopsis poae ATCC 64411]
MGPLIRPVLPGLLGELVEAGDGLARAYADAALGRDRFVTIQFDGGEPAQAYRVANRVRWLLTDGQVEFLGRIDQQVKFRGHHIELAELEKALLDRGGLRGDAIGTGGGIILFNFSKVGGIEDYVGIKPSDLATSYVTRQVASIPGLVDCIRMDVGTAEILGITILTVKRVYCGDMRSHAINRRSLIGKALRSLGESPRIVEAELRTGTKELENYEEELLVGPAFFTDLASRLSGRLDSDISVKDIFNRPVLKDLEASIRKSPSAYSPSAPTPYSDAMEQSSAEGRRLFLDQLRILTAYIVPLAAQLRGRLQVPSSTARRHVRTGGTTGRCTQGAESYRRVR